MAKGVSLELTELQENFVDAFLGECMFDPIKAYKAAGYADSSKIYVSAMKVLKSEAVKRAIHDRMKDMKTAWWLSEEVIVQELWKEAHDKDQGSSHSARINALVWIGKHLGMWQEKKEETEVKPTIVIQNYGAPKEDIEKEVNSPEVVREKDKVSLPEGVQVLDYSKERKH